MQDVKELLKSYLDYDRYARKCFRELDMARESILRSPKMDGMPRSGNTNGLDDVVAQIDRLERKANREREKALKTLDQIYDLIETLKNPRQKAVIKLHYIFGESWEEVAVSIGVKKRMVLYIHGKALSELRKIAPNCTDDVI